MRGGGLMGWSLGYDNTWKRDIGYGVPATCDHPECTEQIDRGLAHVCGGEPFGGEQGCGLYFCANHLSYRGLVAPQQCERCSSETAGDPFGEHFEAKPDLPEWIAHKLMDASWNGWRDDNVDWCREQWAVPAVRDAARIRMQAVLDLLTAADPIALHGHFSQ